MPGGVLHEPSAKSLAALRRWAPELPEVDFVRAVSTFSIDRAHVQQSPRSVVEDLDRIAAAAGTLHDLLTARSDELNDFLGVECAKFGCPMLPEELQAVLPKFAGLSSHASREASKDVAPGRSTAPLTHFVLQLAHVLEARGKSADASGNGPLVLALGIALEDLGLEVADPADTVRKVLNSRKRKQ